VNVKTQRLEKILEQKKASGKKLFCAYITLGFPSIGFTEKIIPQLEKTGVDILELGIPFSDPMADGPIIQEAAQHALKNKTHVKDAFTLVRSMRSRGVTLPIVFFSYYNIIHSMGLSRFIASMKKSGFDGLICPDLPPEEDEGLGAALAAEGISMIYLIAPTSSPKRRAFLAKHSRGFVYYVSRAGVTGVQHSLEKGIARNVKEIKKHTTRNVLVGFGVSNIEQVRSIVGSSDGVIVGSAIISTIKKTKSVSKTLKFIKSLAKGCQ
jgi:tryptophan synthase alpha chain